MICSTLDNSFKLTLELPKISVPTLILSCTLKYMGRRREIREEGTAETLKSHQNLQFESGKDQFREICQRDLSKTNLVEREFKKYLPYSAVPFIQFVNIRENTLPIFLQILCLPPYFNWYFLKEVYSTSKRPSHHVSDSQKIYYYGTSYLWVCSV